LHEAVLLETPFPFDVAEQARVVVEGAWKWVEYIPPCLSKRLRKWSKEIGRAASILLRPGMFPILYGHHLRKGPAGLLGAAIFGWIRFLLGRPDRRLFDLQTDPAELRDCLHAHPEIAERMLTLASKLSSETPAADLPDGSLVPGSQETSESPYSPEEERRVLDHLAQLGYVED
jgi:hypothetical protein